MRRRLAAVLLVVSLAHPAQAVGQEDPRSTRFSLRVGLGLGGGRHVGGLSAISEAALTRPPHRVAVRATILSPIFAGLQEPEVTGYELIYGRALRREHLHASIGTGVSRLSICSGMWPSRVRSDCERWWGIPVVAEAGLHLWALGFGVEAFANLNRLSVFGGLNVYASLGWPP